jgi:aspartate kinase
LDNKLALLVLKFGGTSVADIDRIRNAAQHVKREVDAGHACAVVVSAMAGQTNQRGGAAQPRPRRLGAI